MIHVSYYPSVKVSVFEDKLKDSWISAAIYYYGLSYNFYDKTPEEYAEIDKLRERLRETMPTQYREGAHLLAEQCCFMGEDLFFVDGDFQHQYHKDCPLCGGYRVVSRYEKPWCFTCETHVSFNHSAVTDGEK